MSRLLIHTSRPIILLICITFIYQSQYVQAFISTIETQNQDKASATRMLAEQNAIDEAPEPFDLRERQLREEKNRRNNHGGQDLITMDPELSSSMVTLGPDLSWLPIGSFPIIVLGTVENTQPYLSEDRSFIYTEYSIRVEEIFKTDNQLLPITNDLLIVNRGGGILRLLTGKVINYPATGVNIARPLKTGERYILFLKRADYSSNDIDLLLGPGFQLKDGQSYKLGQREGQERLVGTIPGVPGELSDENLLLELIRNAIKNPGEFKFINN
jgi:hypothetical protein